MKYDMQRNVQKYTEFNVQYSILNTFTSKKIGKNIFM